MRSTQEPWQTSGMAALNGVPVGPEALQTLALVNYGHFTSIRIEAGQARGLSLHLDRLARDCQALFDAEIDRDQVRGFIRQAVSTAPTEVMNIRVTVFDPALEMGSPGHKAEPAFLVTHRAAPSSAVLPPLRVQSARYSREMPSVKHIGLCGTISLRRKAQLAGFDDVVFTESDGRISEGATWNVGFFDGEHVVWPEADVLDGITMQLIQQAHPNFAVRPVTIADLASMQAAFATNVSIGVRPISAIDGISLNENHSVISTLRKAYLGITPEAI